MKGAKRKNDGPLQLEGLTTVCVRQKGGGGEEEEEEVSHCYWCVLYCLSKYSGSFILSLREPSPLNINIMPLKARIM